MRIEESDAVSFFFESAIRNPHSAIHLPATTGGTDLAATDIE